MGGTALTALSILSIFSHSVALDIVLFPIHICIRVTPRASPSHSVCRYFSAAASFSAVVRATSAAARRELLRAPVGRKPVWRDEVHARVHGSLLGVRGAVRDGLRLTRPA